MAELKPAYLLTGGDRPKIRTALERLRGYFDETSVEILSAGEVGGDDAVAACNTLGLFGGERRLVIVEEIDGRRNNDGRLVGAWKAADVKAVVDYLAHPPDGTVLALVGEEVKKDAPLAKACAKVGTVLAYEAPKKRNLATWVAKQFQDRGATADRDACELLVELTGEDTDTLRSEVDKLATWASGDPVTERDVRTLAVSAAEASNFELTDAWGRRDVAGALRAAESSLERSGDPRRDVLPRLAGMLTSHVARVRQCQSLEAAGVTSRDAAAKLKRNPFYVQKLYEQSRNHSVEDLRDATVRLARLDHALKGGSRLAGDLELERALVDLTGRVEPVPARD